MCTAQVEIYQEKYCIEQGTIHHIEHAGAATKKKKEIVILNMPETFNNMP